MPRLDLKKNRLHLSGALRCPPPEEWSSFSNGRFTFPVCGDIFRRLRDIYGDSLEVSDHARYRFREVRSYQKQLEAVKRGEGCVTDERLMEFQETAVAWLSTIKRGILADEQGMGKTVQSLVAAGRCDFLRGVVICTSSKKEEWREHIEDWTDRTCSVLSGDAQTREDIISRWDSGYLVLNYSQAVIHSDDLIAGLVIVDEAHMVRNRKTQQFKALKDIARRCEYLFLLTATPTINAVTDIWSLLHLVDRRRFPGFWSFAFRFCRVDSDGYGLKIDGVKEEESDNLDRMVDQYILRRDRSELEGLPQRNRRIVDHEMTGQQDEVYRQFSLSEILESESGEILAESLTILSKMTRLRQLALHPGMLWPEYRGESKIDTLIGVLRERDSQAVVFTTFATLVDLAEQELTSKGITCTSITGSMNDTKRRESLARFQTGKCQVLLATLKTGGEGLNLVQADRAVFLDLAWHPAGNRHAQDRVYRYGQKADTVETIIIKSKDTIEEDVWAIVSRKIPVTIERLLHQMKQRLKVM